MYTFWNSLTPTLVDYIIGCLQASQFIHSCFTHELSPLNTYDHLPISNVLQIPVESRRLHHSLQDQMIDWVKARYTGCVGAYHSVVSSPSTARKNVRFSKKLDNPRSWSRQPAKPCPPCHQQQRRKSGLKIRNSLSLQHVRKLLGINGLLADAHKQVLSMMRRSGLAPSSERG